MNILGFVKARPIMVLGVVLMLIGFAGPAVLATVHIDITPPNVGTVQPSGSSSVPTVLKLGESYRVYATVDVADRYGLSARVKVDGTWRTLPRVYVGDWYDRYEISLTAPTTEKTITYYWEIKDSAGNAYTKTTYAKSVSPAAGDFYINGKKVTEDTTLTLTTRTLTLKFVATSGASSISKVRIVVAGQLDKTKTSTTGISSYEVTWTASEDGTYTINCYFTSGYKNYQVASILAGLNTEPEPVVPIEMNKFTWIGIAGIALVVVGFVTKH